jgi:hypothetical protein
VQASPPAGSMKKVIPSVPDSRGSWVFASVNDSSCRPTLRSSGDMILPCWKYHARSKPKTGLGWRKGWIGVGVVSSGLPSSEAHRHRGYDLFGSLAVEGVIPAVEPGDEDDMPVLGAEVPTIPN